uniref:Uncharacterized protein n=1 Tax=Oryza sativa subsp. japonica TaxID=39947 RepID=Q6Z0Z5_ORYSJ|nr:hypothetical protein [Oryza sativa Japonica Group]BAD10356.1 hypothetical protein [Oryza sativa Japonica Group]
MTDAMRPGVVRHQTPSPSAVRRQSRRRAPPTPPFATTWTSAANQPPAGSRPCAERHQRRPPCAECRSQLNAPNAERRPQRRVPRHDPNAKRHHTAAAPADTVQDGGDEQSWICAKFVSSVVFGGDAAVEIEINEHGGDVFGRGGGARLRWPAAMLSSGVAALGGGVVVPGGGVVSRSS